MGKHICHLTVDFDMDAEEDIKMVKHGYQDKKHYLIESDFGYAPANDVGSLRTTKKESKLLM